jgi:hypothetical protein
MRGLSADYAMQQQDQEAERRRLLNESGQLDLNNKVADQSNLAGARSILTNQQGLQLGEDASGMTGELRDSANQLKLAQNKSGLDKVALADLESKGSFWQHAANVMKGAGPADAQERWTEVYNLSKEAGIKNLSAIWSPGVKAKVDQMANSAQHSLMNIEKMRGETEKHKNEMEKQKLVNSGHVAAAEASGVNSAVRAFNNRPADERVQLRIEEKINAKPPIPLDTSDIEALRQVEREKAQKDKTVALTTEAKNSFVRENSAGKKELNVKAGLPPDNTDDNKYAAIMVEKQLDKVADDAVKKRIGSAKVIVGDSVQNVSDYVDKKPVAKAAPTAKAASTPTVVKQAGGVPDMRAKPLPPEGQQVKGQIYSTPKGNFLWTGKTFIRAPGEDSSSPTGFVPPSVEDMGWTPEAPRTPPPQGNPQDYQDMGGSGMPPPMMRPN